MSVVQETRPRRNKYAPRGLGFGGQEGFFRRGSSNGVGVVDQLQEVWTWKTGGSVSGVAQSSKILSVAGEQTCSSELP